MCSYNAVNGTPSCANSYLMQDILREHWGWTKDNNYVSTDCNAVLDIAVNHNYTDGNVAQAAADAYNAGTDVVCEVPPPTPTSWALTNQTGAYESGALSEATIDRCLGRLYEGLVRAGYFDGPDAPYRNIDWSSVNTPAAQDLALQVAEKGFVLKKNTGVLPYDFAGKSVAVIGMWGNATYSMLGGYSGTPPYYHNPVYAAQQLGLAVHYATGPTNQSATDTDTWTTDALAAANAADVIVYTGGIDGSVEAEALDRYSIAWPGSQLALMQKLSQLGKPLIVAQMGDQLDDTPILSNGNVSAIVWCGFPGQSGGTALFNILSGKASPAGRLPVTEYPADYVNEVGMNDMYLRPGPGNPGRTYRWFNDSVLPYGFGLHYTKFVPQIRKSCVPKSIAIADLMASCKDAHPDLCPFPKVGITVQNAGNATSDFVALAFLSGDYGPAPYPLKTLAAYTRLAGVAPGATAKATLSMTLGNVARTDVQGNLVLYPGKYTLLLDVPTSDSVSFELTGQAVTLDQFPQPPADAGAAVPA
jgi:beta-D-xylosidase 4